MTDGGVAEFHHQLDFSHWSAAAWAEVMRVSWVLYFDSVDSECHSLSASTFNGPCLDLRYHSACIYP